MATTVAVDANGADLGPAEVAAGALEAAGRGVRVLLFGPAEALGAEAAAHPLVEVVDAPVSIAKAADPARAARATPDASIVRAAQAVGAGEADALVSGGSTGAALAAALFNIKRAPGVHRPALAVSVPVPEHPFTLLDAGANAEVRAEHLVQFAFMGAAFTRGVLGVESPRVGLLSNGEEATKGTALVIETHELLAERVAQAGGALRFVGNVEGTDVTNGAADVVVTDGFTGNIVLKLMEGVSRTMIEAVRDAALASPRGKAGGLLLRPSLSAVRDRLDPELSGGAYLLGLRKLGVVPHGRFSRVGIRQAILLAARGVESGVVDRTHEALEAAGALRSVPEASGAGSSVPSS